MNDQNNEDFKDLEKSLRTALSNEKQTGLSPSQLNSLHLMITKEQFKKTKSRSTWKNWLIPSSVLATAVVALIVINRFPASESNSVLTETSAPWSNQDSSPVASKQPEPQPKLKVAQKKDATIQEPPAASPQVIAESKVIPAESARLRAGPKKVSQKNTKPEPAKVDVAKNPSPKAAKEKSWESKGSVTQSNLASPRGIGGTTSSFGNIADSKAESTPGTGEGNSQGVMLKKNEQKDSIQQTVVLLQVSKISAETSKKLAAAIGKLSICNDKASTWKISFEILKSGNIASPKLNLESGGSEAQKLCISDKIKKWNLGSTTIGTTNLKIKFSGK